MGPITLLFAALACAPKVTPVAAPEVVAPVIDPEKPANVPVFEATPGLNDRFLDPTMDLQEWQDRFEGESREVVAQQEAVLAALDLQPGEVIADIGAGTGLYTFRFAEAVGSAGAVYAVDISPVFLTHLRETVAAQALGETVTVVESEAASTTLSPESIDVAFICDTYHHFDQPESTLASLYAALKPGGRLYLLDFERIEGVSKPFIMGHVRAGKEVFAAEVAAAGFVADGELDAGLTDNYLLRFKKP